jgi:MoaA/NifB/PqqE/SkfB family radical SAM enzyme
MREVIGAYKNGNYHVIILNDGTMIRNYGKEMIPEFPDSMDIKITNKCDRECKFCHEASTKDGKHGKILNVPFLNSLHQYVQLAIGGGNVLEHPDLIPFLIWCKDKNLIPSITLNQKHFIENIDTVRYLVRENLIYGLGVSLTQVTPELINLLREFPNAVLHVIAGIVRKEVLEQLYDNDIKMLILGYKQFRRGEELYSIPEMKYDIDKNINYLKTNLADVIQHFKTVSFDNLAIKQLDVRSLMDESTWKQFYMGDDGKFTMYIDTVNCEYAVSSTSTNRYKYTDESIETMFNTVRQEALANA